ncbi:ABC transporter permease [Halorarum salinum]|uniref:ABC transporter permease n=1 Tax=Halorarum salinum TaxID=2743089 RepID=A0A7D5QK79_9EURY|nr:ABC transporter permease [Halobaculum salinum]QLG64264.1 ABC transporter permease [Halobaculum salinum]
MTTDPDPAADTDDTNTASAGRDASTDAGNDPTSAVDDSATGGHDPMTDGGGATAGAGPTFTDLDWDEHAGAGIVVTRTALAFVGSLLALSAVFLYDYLFVAPGLVLVGSWNPTIIDWLSLLSIVVLFFYVALPLARRPRLTKQYWADLRERRGATLSLAYLAVFTVAGLLGPRLWGHPRVAPRGFEVATRGEPSSLPPFWAAGSMDVRRYCPTGAVDGLCHGTLIHPLGTTPIGQDVLAYVFAGARLALEVTVITAVILVPIATVVGTVAAYYGGRVDVVLMRYVDLQQAVPAFVVYLMVMFLYGPSVVALILLFGLFDWDRIARRVRNDAARRRDAGYVLAAESAGARRVDVIRRHLVPNVSGTVIAGLTTQVPFVLIMEATFSYLGVVDDDVGSWGYAVAVGLESSNAFTWWAYVFPALALFLTALAINQLGTALYEVLQPRQRNVE